LVVDRATVTDTADPTYGVISDASFERSRQRLGIPQPNPTPPHNYEVSLDGLRHFAYGYGDDNPLWCDPEYAAGTRWGGLIAPPAFMYTMGEDASPRPTPPDIKAIMKGDPFAGLGSYQAVMDFEWWRPLQLGDRQKVLRTQVGVQDKPSRFGGRTAHVTIDFIYANQRGELTSLRRGTWVNAERHTSRERKKESDEPEPYTPEQLAEIDAAYEAESRRGAEPRYWEDVAVGDELQRKVKGPLLTTDVIVWHLGWGMQLTPPGAFKLAYNIRKKAPGLYPPNHLNIPDTVQRLHWDPRRAQELGLPTSYDYGGMRETWMCHLLSDWMGDDAWLWKFSCEHRRFNFVGDTTWINGRVTAKRQDERHNEVEVEVVCENQRGVVTSRGSGTVLLPTHDRPLVELPMPPVSTVEAMVDYEMARITGEIDEHG
jgi:acyl dehydratase